MKALYIIPLFALVLSSCTVQDETGFVYGTVTNVNGGKPIAGVIVQCDGISYTTGADGNYRLENISVGIRTITASKTDFENYSKTINIESTGIEVNISMTSNIAGASVWGFVTDSYGSPIANVQVEVAGMTDNTDATGRYQLPSIPEGQYTLRAELDGYELFSQEFYLYSTDKQINIVLRKYHIVEITPDKDAFSTNSGLAGDNDYIVMSNYLRVDLLIDFKAFFHASFDIPVGAEATGLEILIYRLLITHTNGIWTKNWRTQAITEYWDEDTSGLFPETSYNYPVTNISYGSGYCLFNLENLIENEPNNTLQYGFTLYPDFEDSANEQHFASRENSDKDIRPIVRLYYIY